MAGVNEKEIAAVYWRLLFSAAVKIFARLNYFPFLALHFWRVQK